MNIDTSSSATQHHPNAVSSWGIMLNPRSALLGTVLAVSALGCNEATRQGPAGGIHLQVTGGGEQIGVPGQELPEPIVVRVTDDDGRPVSGVLINFVVTAGGGHVFAGSALTNAAGEARERWTLGFEPENLLEARSVDQATGEAIVYATIRATAAEAPAGPPASLYISPEYRYQYRLVGQGVEVRDFVYVVDADGRPVPEPPLTISAGPGLVVAGTSVHADAQLGREVSGMVTVSVANLRDSIRVAFLPDLRPFRWRATYSCRAPSVKTPELDSMINVVALSDSVRQKLYELDADDTYRGLEVIIYMSATATLYYHDGRVVEGPVPRDLATNITGRLFPQRIEYGRVRSWWRPAPGGIQYSPGFSDGTLPPTYLGGEMCDDRFNSHTPGVLVPIQ
jgi:hypothetical protein